VKKDPTDVGYYGLTEEQAAEKLREVGPNALSEKKQLPAIVKFLLTMTGLFNYLLWAGAILSFITYGISADKTDKSNLYLASVLIVVIVVTAIFSYY